VAARPTCRAAADRLLATVSTSPSTPHPQDEDRCIPLRRVRDAMPTDAIKMDRVACSTTWRTA